MGAAMARLVWLGAWRGPGLDISLALTIVGYFLTRQLPDGHTASACTVMGFGLLIPAAAVADVEGLPSVWRRGPMVVLGEWSIAFYMIHLLVMRIGERLFAPYPLLPAAQALTAATAAFLVSLVLAWVLHQAVERPARRAILSRIRHPATRPTPAGA
ncbi:hypothetical protein OHU33_12415 [Streptomyces sp. NBC_00079]